MAPQAKGTTSKRVPQTKGTISKGCHKPIADIADSVILALLSCNDHDWDTLSRSRVWPSLQFLIAAQRRHEESQLAARCSLLADLTRFSVSGILLDRIVRLWPKTVLHGIKKHGFAEDHAVV